MAYNTEKILTNRKNTDNKLSGVASIVVPSGYIYRWGYNTGYNLATGPYNSSLGYPKFLGATNEKWKAVSGGGSGLNTYFFAIKYDNTLWGAGVNSFGQLGNNSTLLRSELTQIGSLSTWKFACAGGHERSSLGLQTDGTLWSWGYNNNGQLGQGDVVNRSSPVKIGSDADWAYIANNGNTSYAIKTDGTLWSWGLNSSGELGQGDVTSRSSPVKIGTGTTWNSVILGLAHVVATRTDGTIWSWGQNAVGYGQLGLGDVVNRSSPVQIGTLTTWKPFAMGQIAGQYHTVATKTDGTLWAWGRNSYGQLGQGNTTSRSSPVQIGSLTSWISGSGGADGSFGLKSDGTLWSWGDGTNYRMGIGYNTVAYTSPVQVGNIKQWSYITGGNSVFAMRSSFR